MKYFSKILIVLIACIILPRMVFAFVVPSRPAHFVSDYASILTPEDETLLEGKISSFEKATTNEIAVVTIPSLDGDTIENVAQDIFTTWGIGKKDKNNGVLFLVSVTDRKTRIHTGYGLEGSLTDIGTSYIQSEIVRPAFQAGNYKDGIEGAVDSMIGLIQGKDMIPSDYVPQKEAKFDLGDLMYGAFFAIIVIQWISAVLARSKSWWAGGVLGLAIGVVIGLLYTLVIGFIAAALLGIVGLLLDYFVSKSYQSHKADGTKYPWFIGGGGWGSGGSSGGFGGFGGGASGGGGSSGSW